MQILDAVKNRLELITPGNGYVFNAAGRVHHGRNEVAPDDLLAGTAELQMIPGRTIKQNGGVKMEMVMPLTVRGLVKAAPTDPLDNVEPLLMDIKRAIFVDGQDTLGGLATHVGYVDEETFDRMEGGSFSAVEVGVQIIYFERYGDPSAPPA